MEVEDSMYAEMKEALTGKLQRLIEERDMLIEQIRPLDDRRRRVVENITCLNALVYDPDLQALVNMERNDNRGN